MKKSIRLEHLTLGVCYYPEHWPESMWAEDLDRMLAAGITVCRVAEFAWSKFEKTEGVFTFDFFDRFLDLAAEKGMKVIFCTPTATPPAWLTEKYPEVLNALPDGTLVRHGMRCHCNHTSPVFLKLCARVVEQIAAHYGQHPAIIGWQIDNEINCETSQYYSESDSLGFRAYLKRKFGTLEKLNEAMGTVFWNQEYTDWDEIFVARPTLADSPNPHLLLEQKKFVSESAIAFFKLQADILKKHRKPEDFITTNGMFGHLDYLELNRRALDFITYDSYPNFAYAMGTGTNANASAAGKLKDRSSGLSLSRVRSVSPNFGIMEQQSGGGGWQTRLTQPAPLPGQLRLWAYQSIAHGADFISFFRWRTCTVGTEIYWNGILPWDNRDSRQLEEVKRLRRELENLSTLAGGKYRAKMAVGYHYQSEWDGEGDVFHGPLSGPSVMNWFYACQVSHTPMDLLCLDRELTLEELQAYELLVLPHIALLPKSLCELLETYISQGGKVIFGARTGFKDEFGRCPMAPAPGAAARLVGGTVREYTLVPKDRPASVALFGEEVPMPLLHEILEAEDGEVLARYHGSWYDGSPAVLRKPTGKGEALYFGAAFSEEAAFALLRHAGLTEACADALMLPPEIEYALREKDGHACRFLLNYTEKPQPFLCKKPLTDLLTGEQHNGETVLPPFGVMALA
ncbi:beta-galactosidase [Neglectibacter caecimuris]|uniref:beta-galactosidase n=1 Tax=Neglectibacter caecimuris TaxID=3093658 RepID=UPI002AC938C8|nr:beta-galactosidase [Neglectibacter sp. M00184]